MLVVKIYEGDKAEDILSNLTSNKDLELDEEDIVNIERVIRHHCRPWHSVVVVNPNLVSFPFHQSKINLLSHYKQTLQYFF